MRDQGDPDASSLNFPKELKLAHPLLNSEVALLLQSYIQQRESVASSSGIPFPGLSPPSLKALEHVNSFSRYPNRELLREIRQSMLMNKDQNSGISEDNQTNGMGMSGRKGRGLVEFEMVQVGNLAPETVDEAKALVPSLAGAVEEEELQRILDEIAAIQRFQSQ